MNRNVGRVESYSLEENKKINNVGIACYAIQDHKAITLVALIITIIVMLILAGVTLSIAFGENGIFSQSKLAVQKYENARLKEEQELQNISNTITNLGVASNRDETTNYEERISRLEATVNELKTQNEGLSLLIANLNSKNQEIETKLNIVTTPKTISQEEHLTGEFYNDKPIYAKTIYISALPNKTTGTYNHEIADVETIWFDLSKTYAVFSNGDVGSLPFLSFDNTRSIALIDLNNTSFDIVSNIDRRNVKAYVTLNYTKTDNNN